ncbi:MAG: hypothetical protein MSIBF_00620 [Candidatus Altiarchaeales archaeon IMC4]|nr:MAG: hypothetical protein MSIBF_00620 [Candidatus Altiarchaeales archaeon IMC4]
MNTKRVIIATLVGVLCGLFCAYGAIWKNIIPPMLAPVLFIVYNRTLIGFFVGIADGVDLEPVVRGALIGALVTAAWVPDPKLIGFGMVYGMIADVVATRYSKAEPAEPEVKKKARKSGKKRQ